MFTWFDLFGMLVCSCVFGGLFIRRLGLGCWYSVFDTWFGLLELWLL